MSGKLYTDLFINSKWVTTSKTFPVKNPATGDELAQVSHAGVADIEAAIQSAHHAFKLWKNQTAKYRSEKLSAWYKIIMEHKERLAEIITLEGGKPFKESLGEVIYGASFIEWAAEQGKRIDGAMINSPLPNSEINVTFEPVGVVGAIAPWNFPLAMITRKIAPAIAAGCSVVIKPSELTPLTALYLAHLSTLAGFPEGLINFIVGDPVQIGEALTRDKRIRKITFTGSTRVGKLLLSQSVDTLKKVSLELGGNAPFIVFADANLDEAVNNLVLCKFRNGGQTCVCANRIYVEQPIYAEFAAKLKDAVALLKIGNGINEDTNIGPLINMAGKQKVLQHIYDAKSKGATVYFGGNEMDGQFVQPTILTNVPDNAIIATEETFGPVAPLFSFSSEEEVIKRANNTPFGLAAYFFTSDYKRIWRVKRELEAGMVGVNTGLLSVENAPFGGVKESGLGREGGQLGIYDFVEAKYTMNKF
jgi:succinate-semialdehyde dehydrogenase/glutarate-semialdehyde dehydrogenase